MHALFDLAPLAVAGTASAMVVPAALREFPRACRTASYGAAAWQAAVVLLLAAAVLTPTIRLTLWAADAVARRAVLAALGVAQ